MMRPIRVEEHRFPNITRWMRANGMNQIRFAELLGISNTSLSYILRGINDPKLFTINAVLRVTGMTFEEAFREAEP